MEFFIFEEYQNLNFWWYFKISWANYLWANFGNFGQIWADYATLVVVERMPKARLKSKIFSSSSTVSPNATWSGSLESYDPYLCLKKFQKIHKFIAFIVACSKIQKATLTSLEL
jgi:hypothetical protein